MTPRKATIASWIRWLFGSVPRSVPSWPPDIFALTTSILQLTGAYSSVIASWPPSSGPTSWADQMKALGLQWRRRWKKPGHKAAPARVQELWQDLVRRGGTPLAEVPTDRGLCAILIELAAAADEASVGVGIPGSSLAGIRGIAEDQLYENARDLLTGTSAHPGSTLCQNIDPSSLRVLPKLHTPRSGLTVRSMSHHLALSLGNEVTPQWTQVPGVRPATRLNLLIAPWPLEVEHGQFRAVSSLLANMPSEYGIFAFDAKAGDGVDQWLESMLAAARASGIKVDGVVFPELALAAADFSRVRDVAVRYSVFLICGVAEAGPPARNLVRIDVPGFGRSLSLPEQEKHHRWQLDRFQIQRYGLERQLSTKKLWWEEARIQGRTLNFVALSDWLTFSVLICEDLARPDPAGDMVRAVGPNLVVALLMDGPQHESRWSSRYATALADDPGCSVLAVTSLGMTQLKSAKAPKNNARSVALWKDALSGRARPIALDRGAEAVVLQLRRRDEKQWTADGRHDGGSTTYLFLDKVHQVRRPRKTVRRVK